MSCGAPARLKSAKRESGTSIAGCSAATAATTSSTPYGAARGGRSRPMRKANSASATRIRFAPKGRAAPSSDTISASSRPASGPSTLMCACPAALVAAIFQP